MKAKQQTVWLLLIGMAALLMLTCAAGADAQARFRAPAMPFLAMLASIGWLGRRPIAALSSGSTANDATISDATMTFPAAS
jgi:hypothetical protein